MADPVCRRYSISPSWLAELGLHGDVLPVRVADVDDEEQPRVEPAEVVVAVGEVVAAPKHLHPVVLRRVGQPDVRVQRDQRLAVGPDRVKVRRRELLAAGQRGTVGPVAADQRLLLARRRPVPRLDVHVDPPGDQERPAREPLGVVVVAPVHPHVLVDGPAVLGLEVGRAVLEPEQVARRLLRRRRGRRTPEAELGPAQRRAAEGDAREVADGVYGDLRIVRARLHAQIPFGARRLQGVGGEVRQPPQATGLPVRQAEPVVAVLVAEQRRAEAEGEREPGRREAERLAGVGGRGVVRQRRPTAHRAAPGHLRRRGRPGLEQRHELGPRRGGHVEGGEVQPVLRRGDDAGLVLAVEAVLVDRRTVLGPGCGDGRAHAARETGGADGRAGTGVPEQPPPADALPGRVHRVTAAVSLDSGSDSALTASESCRTSGFESLR